MIKRLKKSEVVSPSFCSMYESAKGISYLYFMSKPRRKARLELPGELNGQQLHLAKSGSDKPVALKPGKKVILADRVTYTKK